jgi:hypothetical protein
MKGSAQDLADDNLIEAVREHARWQFSGLRLARDAG